MRLAALPRWWHLLSLDAPTVAALWSWSIAAALGVRLPWSAPLLLALGTWLIYVADRILDGLLATSLAALRERHFFYARHRRVFLIAAIPVGLALLWLIVARMNAAARHDDFVVFSVALLYFCVVHVYRSAAERWLPKELAVGVVFAAATAVPAWSRLPRAAELIPGRFFLLFTVLFFAALCWLNCVAIEKWERERDSMSVESSAGPHRSTLWAQQRLRRLCIGMTLTALLAAGCSRLANAPAPVTAIFLSCAMTATAFVVLDTWQSRLRLSAFYLRIAADAAMLTPLIFALVLR
jgi:hypothetical protein